MGTGAISPLGSGHAELVPIEPVTATSYGIYYYV
jgi:hypothetical protein